MFLGKKKTKRLAALGSALMLGLSLMISGCGGGSSKSASGGGGAAKDKILTMGFTNAPSSFNPLSTPDIAGHFINRFMFDTLLGQPELNKFTPHLALRIDTKDKQTYTIKLNPKAKWSDGKPITADDVVYTLNLVANPDVLSSLGRYMNFLEGVSSNSKVAKGAKIPSVKKIDDHTVEFKTKSPIDPNIVKNGIGFNIPIVPMHVFSKLDAKNIANAPEVTSPKVFSGPYKFVKYVTNDHVEMAANKEYVLGEPQIKRVFLTISSDTNLVVNLKAGKVSINAPLGVGKIPVKEMDGLKADKKLKLIPLPATGTQFLMANNQQFDVHFRRALSYAINKQQIKDQIYKGYADITPTLYTLANAAYDPTVKDLEYNPEKAREELAKSKFDKAAELTMLVPLGNLMREQSGDLIQQNLKAVGLNVKIAKLDFPTMLARARKGDFQLLLIGLGQPLEPDYTTYFVPGSMSNYSQTDDPELIAMFDAGIKATDFADRKKIYQKIQHYLVDKQYQCSLYNPKQVIVKDKNLVGGENEFMDGSLDEVYKWHFTK